MYSYRYCKIPETEKRDLQYSICVLGTDTKTEEKMCSLGLEHFGLCKTKFVSEKETKFIINNSEMKP